MHFPEFLDLIPLKKVENHGEKIMGSWPTEIMKSQPLNHPSANRMVRDFRDEISYKN